MVDIVGCVLESEIDTMEIALRKRRDELISSGNIEEADRVDITIESLDKIKVCEE